MKETSLIFLDFDGVLFDTVKEAYCISLIASGKATSMREIRFGTVHYRTFRQYRYLITSAWTYYCLLKAIDSTIESDTSIVGYFHDCLRNADKRDYGMFEAKFFLTRKALREGDDLNWLLLNSPYPFMDDLRPLIQNHPNNFCIITTKDRETVLKLLQVFDCPFNANNIAGHEVYEKFNTKKAIIELVVHEKRPERFLLIDDSSKHIQECGEIPGIITLQPDWGYVAPHDLTSCRDEIVNEVKKILGG